MRRGCLHLPPPTSILLLLSFALLLSTLVSVSAHAATYTAASCNESDVQAAYNTEHATPADGDIIAIPAGNCTGANAWSTLLILSPNNSLTIQGAGAVTPDPSCTFAPGSACTTSSGTDQTVLQMNANLVLVVNTAADKSFRITGIEYYFPNGGTISGNGAWVIQGYSQAVRIDHNHFWGYQDHWLNVNGWIYGVADHNWIDYYRADTNWINLTNGANWNNDSVGFGDKSWADDSYWGSSEFFFVENNVFNDLEGLHAMAIDDCSHGGRAVYRYNTLTHHSFVQAHEGGGNTRGCRAGEIYGNTDTATIADNAALASARSGSEFVWGNVGTWGTIYTPYQDRMANVNGTFTPLGPGMCGQGFGGTATTNGTAVTWVSGYQPGSSTAAVFSTYWPTESTYNMFINGVKYAIQSCSSTTSCTLTTSAGVQSTPVAWYAPSIWDRNTDSSGYPCLDQPGRGKGDLLTGTFDTRINSATGEPSSPGNNAWPRQAVDPSYVWANTNNMPGGACLGTWPYMLSVLAPNRDVYQQFGTGCEAGSFEGSKGVGEGLLSARPTTCTAGTDAATGGPAPGVGYWATDATNPQDASHPGVLYVCNPTNTWTSYYTPYTYPHPLTQSASGSPAPPTSLSAIVE